jgi:hypothetical protein
VLLAGSSRAAGACSSSAVDTVGCTDTLSPSSHIYVPTTPVLPDIPPHMHYEHMHIDVYAYVSLVMCYTLMSVQQAWCPFSCRENDFAEVL